MLSYRALKILCITYRRIFLSTRKPVKLHAIPISSTTTFLNGDVTKLTTKDEENIIFILNTFSKEQLRDSGVVPSLLLEEMCARRDQQGSFLSLGDVLSLPGMDNKVFQNICNTFQPQRHKPGITIQDPDFLKYFSPTLNSETMENIQTVTSLEVCLDSVCYASTTRTHQVMAWDQVSLFGTNHSKQSPAEILEQAVHVIPHIPKADIYLIETKNLRKISTQYMQILLFIARLQTAIQTLISSEQLTNTGQHSFFHVKDSFLNRMFDLRVGGERVSGQHILQQMEDGEFAEQIDVTPNLWHRFHRLESGVQKERFANCLLMSIAFANYIGPDHKL